MTTEITKIIADQTLESLHLEFKRSSVVRDKKRDDICKAVSAMANSNGGRVVFGIEEDKSSNKFRLDGGIAEAPRAIEWLDSVLSDNISPRILGIVIASETVASSSYISIEIPRSAGAPHQSPDGRFYKRSNNRSFPMEAYEIDDIRQRRFAAPNPITVSFEVEPSTLARLVIRNRSELVCRNLRIDVRSNFPMSAFGGNNEGQISLSRVGAEQKVEYTMGTAHGILGAAADAAFEIQGTYVSEASNNPIQIVDRISVGELAGSAIPHNDTSEKMKKIAEELKGVREEIKKSTAVLEQIAETFSGSGIRLSPYSIFQLSQPAKTASFASFKYDAAGLTLQGMAEVLETTTDVIANLYRTFQVIGGQSLRDDELGKLPSDIAERAKARLNFERY